MTTKVPRSADDLKHMLAHALGLRPDDPRAQTLIIAPMGDTWRAMSGRYDDTPDFRSAVIKCSIELAMRYDLEA